MYNYNMFNNSFMGYYVNDYSEVLNYAAPTNGSPILFANLNEGLLWSKKIIDGTPVVQPYRIMPINQEGQPQQTIKQSTSIDEKLDTLITLLLKKEGGNESTDATTNATKST